MTDSVCPIQKESSTYIENIFPFTDGSKGPAVIRLDIEDRGSYVFIEALGMDN